MYSTALKSTSPSALKCECAMGFGPGNGVSTWKKPSCSSSVTSLGSRSHRALASFRTVSLSLMGKLMNDEYVLTIDWIFESVRYSSSPSLTWMRISVPRVRSAESSGLASPIEYSPVPDDDQTYGVASTDVLLTTETLSETRNAL